MGRDFHIKLGKGEILSGITLSDEGEAQMLHGEDDAGLAHLSKKCQCRRTRAEDLSGFLLSGCIGVAVEKEVR